MFDKINPVPVSKINYKALNVQLQVPIGYENKHYTRRYMNCVIVQ